MNCELCESRPVYHVVQKPPIVLNVCRECHAVLSRPMTLEGCVAGPAWIEIVERTQTEFARRCERLRVLAGELCQSSGVSQ